MIKLSISGSIDLKGQTKHIDRNTLLQFDGGSFFNGTLVGNNTIISAHAISIFGENLKLEGSWQVDEAYFEWFGAVGDGKHDDSLAFKRGIDSPFSNFKLLDRIYTVSGKQNNGQYGIVLSKPIKITGTSHNDIFSSSTGSQIKVAQTTTLDALALIASSNIQLANIEFCGGEEQEFHTQNILKGSTSHTLYNIKLINLLLFRCKASCIDMCCFLSEFKQINMKYCFRGIYLHGNQSDNVTSTIISSCYVFAATDCAYDLRNCMYCTLTSCATDRSGNQKVGESQINTGSGYAYSLFGCQNTSLISCACELSYLILTLSTCTGISILSFFDWTNNRNQMPANYQITRQINLSHCRGVSFSNCIIGTSINNSAIISLWACNGVQFTNCSTRLPSGEFRNGFIEEADTLIQNT